MKIRRKYKDISGIYYDIQSYTCFRLVEVKIQIKIIFWVTFKKYRITPVKKITTEIEEIE